MTQIEVPMEDGHVMTMTVEEPETGPTPDENLAALKDIQAAEHDAAHAEAKMLMAQEAAKAAKKSYEAAVERLRGSVRKSEAPLFQQAPAVAETTGEEWRAVRLDSEELNDPPIPAGTLTMLADNGIETLGTLVDHQSDTGDFWVKEIKGLGASRAEKISNAVDGYWARNPQPD